MKFQNREIAWKLRGLQRNSFFDCNRGVVESVSWKAGNENDNRNKSGIMCALKPRALLPSPPPDFSSKAPNTPKGEPHFNGLCSNSVHYTSNRKNIHFAHESWAQTYSVPVRRVGVVLEAWGLLLVRHGGAKRANACGVPYWKSKFSTSFWKARIRHQTLFQLCSKTHMPPFIYIKTEETKKILIMQSTVGRGTRRYNTEKFWGDLSLEKKMVFLCGGRHLGRKSFYAPRAGIHYGIFFILKGKKIKRFAFGAVSDLFLSCKPADVFREYNPHFPAARNPDSFSQAFAPAFLRNYGLRQILFFFLVFFCCFFQIANQADTLVSPRPPPQLSSFFWKKGANL